MLHRYRPCTVQALATLLRREEAQRLFLAHSANLLWLLAKSAGVCGELTPPGDILLRTAPRTGDARDTRSGAQIAQALAARLRGEQDESSREDRKGR